MPFLPCLARKGGCWGDPSSKAPPHRGLRVSGLWAGVQLLGGRCQIAPEGSKGSIQATQAEFRGQDAGGTLRDGSKMKGLSVKERREAPNRGRFSPWADPDLQTLSNLFSFVQFLPPSLKIF